MLYGIFSVRYILIIPLLVCGLTVLGQINVSTYTFSTATSGVLEDVTTPAGTLINSAQEDVSSSVTNIGFTFNYSGVNYTQFSVSSNGLMGLGATQILTTAVNSLTANPLVKIAPYWDDLTTGSNGKVVYRIVGTAPNRKLVVNWNVRIPKGGITTAVNANFQCWLEETSNIITFVYGTAGTNTGNYSIGVTNSATSFHSVSVSTNTSSTSTANNSNTSGITAGRLYRFTPPAPSCASALSPSTGSTGVSPNPTLTWNPGTTGSVPSSYDVYFGTTTTPPLVSTSQAGTSYTPTGPLALNTVYYWYVVPKNAGGSATGCTTNSFTTATGISYEVQRSTGVSFGSIAATGTAISSWRNGSNTDDNLSNSIPIGFNFSYVGGSFSNVLVSTNGFITLNTASASNGASSADYSYLNANLSASDATKSPVTLAPFWDDLTCQGNPSVSSRLEASVRYQTSGTAPNRVFVVEWIGMETAVYQGADLNFQVRIYETTGVIEFVYGTMTGFFGNITPGSLPTFTYSLGINSWTMSATPLGSELITQQIHNTRSFSAAKKDNLATVPECNSMIRYVPGTYTAYVPPASLAPANDLVANAITMPVVTEPCTNLCGNAFSSANATGNGGVIQATGMGPADDDVWFKFTATKSSISIRALGSSQYDPSIEVFNSATTPIASSSAINSGNRINATNALPNPAGQGLMETANLTGLTVGNTYLFRVFHGNALWGQSGDFAVCVYETPLPPANDNCAGAISLTIGATCVGTAGSSLTATASTGVDTCSLALRNPDDDIWYRFTAVSSKQTVRVTSGHKYDAVIQVFSGACGSLVPIACQDQTKNAQEEILSLTGLTVGDVYYIRVYQSTISAGRGSFSICVTSPLPGCVTTQIPGNGTANVPFGGTTLSWNRVTDATGYDIYLDTISPPVNLIATNHPDTFIFSGSLTKGNTYYYRIDPRSPVGAATGCFTSIFASEPFGYNLIIKAFLQTYYKGGRRMVATIHPNDSICDTITVKLYNPFSPYALQYTTKALLDTNGVAYAEFPQPALQQSYYIAVEHRNHLETWSSSPFAFNDPDTTYDFTNAASAAFGSNLRFLETGVFGLYGGDANQDDAINVNDMIMIGNRANAFGVLYRPEDITGDQVVETSDYSLIESLIFNSISLIRP